MILIVGKKYKAELEDCCIVGEFKATLKEIEYSDEGKEQPPFKTVWDNGVTLKTQWGVTYEEII